MNLRTICAAGLLALGLAACSDEQDRLPRRAMALCGSRHTAEALMGIVFERATARAGEGGAKVLTRAQAQAMAFVEAPKLAGYDEGTESVHCTGVLHIVLAGTGSPTAKGPEVSADVEYGSTPDPEGDGVRYSLAGGDDAVAELAQADPAAWASRAAPAAPIPEALPASGAIAEDGAQAAVADDAAAVGDTGRSKRSPDAASGEGR